MRANAPETVVAYQRLRLREIRELYEKIDPDLDRYIGVERNVSEGIDTLEVQFGEVRDTLISLGVDPDGENNRHVSDHQVAPLPPKSRAKHPPSSTDFEELVTEAGRYLAEAVLTPPETPCSRY